MSSIQPSKINNEDSDLIFAPKKRGFKRVTETVLTIFASGHGFSKGSAGGTASDDTSDFFKGEQSYKLTTPSNGASVFCSKTSINPTIDMTGKFIKIWVKTDNVEALTELWVYLSSDNITANYYTFKFIQNLNDSILKNNVWTCLTCSLTDAQTTGAPTRNAINAIRVRATASNGSTANVWFGGIHAVSEPSAGVVIFSFDDGFDSVYTEAKSYMDKYGYQGVAYVIPWKIGDSGRLTEVQVKQLHFEGWDIGGHDEPNMTTLTLPDVAMMLKQCKADLTELGITNGIEHYAYPNGGYNADVENVLKKYYQTARTIKEQAETIPPADEKKLRIWNVTETDTFASVQTRITACGTNKDCLNLVFHNIVETVTDSSTQISISKFQQIVDEVATQGRIVKTLSQLIADN